MSPAGDRLSQLRRQRNGELHGHGEDQSSEESSSCANRVNRRPTVRRSARQFILNRLRQDKGGSMDQCCEGAQGMSATNSNSAKPLNCPNGYGLCWTCDRHCDLPGVKQIPLSERCSGSFTDARDCPIHRHTTGMPKRERDDS